MDTLTKQQRSYCMSQIKCSNTKPEIFFRKYLWKRGTKGYRIKAKITGKPDLYFPSKRVAVFIDGCFWHKCPVCFKAPKTNSKFWKNKIENNVKRDKKVNNLLQNENITVVRFWQHEIKKEPDKCYKLLKSFLFD